MKQFFKMLLAVICGLLIMSIISLFLFAGFIGALASSGGSKPVLPRSGILKIDMSRIILKEQSSIGDPFSILKSNSIVPVGIWNAVQAINFAAADPGVKFIYLKTDGVNAGIAQLEEFRKALDNFRKSGKVVVAYTENPMTSSYYLASVADKIYMSSYTGSGAMITGVGTQMFFLKDILDKFGVNVQLIRHGKYKSAGEMFIKNAPSPENLEQTQAMINSIWDSIAEEIAEKRGIEKDSFSKMIDNLVLDTPEDMLGQKLVDEIVTKDELKAKLAELEGEDNFKPNRLIRFSDYVTAKVSPNLKAKKKIAIIFADGEIKEGNDNQNIAGDRFTKIISDVNADSSVKAVVLRVSSPGGSVLASDKIKKQLDKLGKEKLLIASFGNYAASGGYWISNNSAKIYCNKTTLTGSIGVFSMIPDLSGTAKNVFKIGVTSVGSNKHSDMYSMLKPLDKKEKEYIQKGIENVYSCFVENVAEGRDLRPSYVDSIAQGRVWTGAEALKLNLIDEIGTLEDAVHYTAVALEGDSDLSKWEIATYPKPLTEFESIMAAFDDMKKDEDVLAGTPFKNIVKTFRNWNFETFERYYARMPYEYIIK